MQIHALLFVLVELWFVRAQASIVEIRWWIEMGMQQLITIARWEVFLLVGGLFLIVVYKIFTGTISLQGVLTGDRRDGSEFFSPGRLQTDYHIGIGFDPGLAEKIKGKTTLTPQEARQSHKPV
jgi:hypothetical protein